MTAYWAERALLPEGVAAGVVLESGDDGRLSAVRSEAAPAPAGAVALGGLVLPGLADQHSHAFHRALRGRAAGGDFWAWRTEMYALAGRLDPDTLLALATARGRANELEAQVDFPHVVVNDDVQKAASELERLVRDELSLH